MKLLSLITAAAILAGPSPADEIPAKLLSEWPGYLAHAHSHNDDEQKRPLLDAVASRITSVEADLYLEGEVIMVAHDRGKWRGEFESLYLKPLNELWQKGTLPVRVGEPFLLWLDLKDGSAALRHHLHRLLEACQVTSHADPAHARVQVILTGDKTGKEAFRIVRKVQVLLRRHKRRQTGRECDGVGFGPAGSSGAGRHLPEPDLSP